MKVIVLKIWLAATAMTPGHCGAERSI